MQTPGVNVTEVDRARLQGLDRESRRRAGRGCQWAPSYRWTVGGCSWQQWTASFQAAWSAVDMPIILIWSPSKYTCTKTTPVPDYPGNFNAKEQWLKRIKTAHQVWVICTPPLKEQEINTLAGLTNYLYYHFFWQSPLNMWRNWVEAYRYIFTLA